MTILTAKVAPVKLGQNVEIEGLCIEDGRYGVAVQQAASLFQLNQAHASRDLKALLVEGSSFAKVKTDRESVENIRSRSTENAVMLPDFENVLLELAIKGNKQAIVLSRALVGLALVQLFSDAFEIKFEKVERQLWLTDRFETKELFWDLTEAIKSTIEATGNKATSYDYASALDAVNKGLFGKTSQEIRTEIGLKSGAIRDCFGRRALRRITAVQEASARRILRGQKPLDAIAQSIYEFAYELVDFRS